MATELDIADVDMNSPVALALILDGREQVAVPSWVLGGSPIQCFRPVPPGPILIMNTGYGDLDVAVWQSESPDSVVEWITRSRQNNGELANYLIPLGKITTVVPSRAFAGIKVPAGGLGMLRPVGTLVRGPSAMSVLDPIVASGL